jgi:hypothetical protein
MALPPLPAMKPNEQGGYTFCPKCALMWFALLAFLVGAYLYAKKGKAIGSK